MTAPLPVNPATVPPYQQIVPSQVSAFTVANMVSQITRQFGDEANVQINNTDIIRWINMGLVEIARNNRVWEKTAIILSVVPDFTLPNASNFSMPLPNDCVMLQAVSYDGKILPGFDFEQLISQVNGNMSIVGTPTCY